MKKLILIQLAVLTFVCFSQGVIAKALPPFLYTSTLESDEIYDKIKDSELFSALDKEGLGNSLRLYVSHRFEATAGGMAAGLTSAMLAGGSLGLLPLVTNDDLVLTYEIRVHNQSIASFDYRENFTQAKNIYSEGGLYTMDKEEKAWALSTVARFLDDAAKSKELMDLSEEYDFYFSDIENNTSE